MRKIIILVLLFAVSRAYSQNLPAWLLKSFKTSPVSKTYYIKLYLKPAYFQADFNGDGVKDLVTTVIEKKSGKKGLIIMYGNSPQYFVIGAGKKMGKTGSNYGDDLKWADGWDVCKDKVAEETKFDKSGDIAGSVKRKLINHGISVWQSQDGSPLAGFIVSWNGKAWDWIHQGE